MFRRNALFLIYLVLALILLIGKSDHKMAKANFLSTTIYYPFINTLNSLEKIFLVQEENNRLIDNLAKKTILVNNLENKLKNYKESETNIDITAYDYIISDVVGYTGNYNERNIIVNYGRKNGVKQNHPVIAASGVVGKVVTTSRNYSVVMPLSHPAFKLGVMTRNSRVQGLLESDVYGNTFMGMINLGSQITLGDTIVTSNISSFFPKNIPIGTVSRITDAGDKVHMNAYITPEINPYGLDKLFLLLYSKDKDYEKELGNE